MHRDEIDGEIAGGAEDASSSPRVVVEYVHIPVGIPEATASVLEVLRAGVAAEHQSSTEAVEAVVQPDGRWVKLTLRLEE